MFIAEVKFDRQQVDGRTFTMRQQLSVHLSRLLSLLWIKSQFFKHLVKSVAEKIIPRVYFSAVLFPGCRESSRSQQQEDTDLARVQNSAQHVCRQKQDPPESESNLNLI